MATIGRSYLATEAGGQAWRWTAIEALKSFWSDGSFYLTQVNRLRILWVLLPVVLA
jgi:hypothetical protein